GWKQFDDYSKIRELSGRDKRAARPRELSLVDEEATAAWPVLTRVSQLPFLAGNAVNLLIDGEETFASIFAVIAAAKSSILMQFFIIRDDQIVRALADALIVRAMAVVSVNLLYEVVGVKGVQ